MNEALREALLPEALRLRLLEEAVPSPVEAAALLALTPPETVAYQVPGEAVCLPGGKFSHEWRALDLLRDRLEFLGRTPQEEAAIALAVLLREVAFTHGSLVKTLRELVEYLERAVALPPGETHCLKLLLTSAQKQAWELLPEEAEDLEEQLEKLHQGDLEERLLQREVEDRRYYWREAQGQGRRLQGAVRV